MFGYYLNLALRSLKRNKVLTFLMVLAISVGIGASMTTLTVMHILSGDPLPGKSAHIFYPQVDASHNKQGHAPIDMLDYRSAMDLWSAHRARYQTLVTVASMKVRVPHATTSALMTPVQGTTSEFFPMFNVPFQYGSAWPAADDTNGARVAVISARLNQRLFGGAGSVDKTLVIAGDTVRIVGVLAPWRPSPLFYDVRGGRYANGRTSSLYRQPEGVFMPLQTGLAISAGSFMPFTCWGKWNLQHSLVGSPCAWVGLWVELGSAAEVADYRKFIAHYARQQKQLGRFTNTRTRMMNLMQWLDYNQVVPSNVKLQTWLAFAFLAICLFNTVGLLLAKFLRRASEIGVRRALGASRGAVAAQCLIEAGLIGLVGGLGGLLLTLAGLWLVRQEPVAYAAMARLDVGMFVVTFALAVATSLIAGAIPAWRASRIAPAIQLKTL